MVTLQAQAFTPSSYKTNSTKCISRLSVQMDEKDAQMKQIVDGVEFDTIAREWRCKFISDGNKASLVACQMALESVAQDLWEVEGVKSVERVVCGDCLDFKVSAFV